MVRIKNMGQVNTNKDEPIDIGDLISEAFLLTKGKEDREELVLDYLCQSVTKADNYDALVMKAKNKEPYAYIQLASWHISHAENVKDYCKALEYAKKAVQNDYVEGYYILGQLYYYGTGCEKNIIRALKYFHTFLKQIDHKQIINDIVIKDTYQKLIEGNIILHKFSKAEQYMEEFRGFDASASLCMEEYERQIAQLKKGKTQMHYKQSLCLLGGVLFFLLLFLGVKHIFPDLDLNLRKPIRKESTKVSPDEYIIYADTVTQQDASPVFTDTASLEPSIVSASDFYNQSLQEVPPQNAWASSEYISSKGIDYSVNCLVDHNVETVWQEGVLGSGIGECIHFDFDGEVELYGIILSNGKMSSEEGYFNNNRLAEFKLIGEEEVVIRVEDVFEKQYIFFEHPIKGCSVDIVINKVFAGLKYDDTCVTDIEFFTK